MKKMITLILATLMFLCCFAPGGGYAADGVTKAQTIQVNTPVTEQLSSSQEIDWFKVTLDQPGSLQVKFEYPSNAQTDSWQVILYKIEDGKQDILSSAQNGDEISSGKPTKTLLLHNIRLPKGDYYIRVNSLTFNDSDYTLTANFIAETKGEVEKEFNDTSQTAHSISANTAITGNLSRSGDIDWFKVTLDKAGSLQVKFEYPSDAQTDSWQVILYKIENGKQDILSSAQNGDEISSGKPTKTLLLKNITVSAGEYYIRVNSLTFNNADYTLTVLTEDPQPDDKGNASGGYICSSWAEGEIAEADENGLIPTVLKDEDLTEKIDRAEFAAVAVQMYEVLKNSKTIAPSSCPFTDINSNPSKIEIEKAYKLGITTGTSPTTFDPLVLINREQLATMLCRAIKKYKFNGWTYETDSDYYLGSTLGVKKFADDADISEYAKDSVYFMAKMGIIKGVDDTHFAPKNTTSREEAIGYAMATREQAIIMANRIYKISDML